MFFGDIQFFVMDQVLAYQKSGDKLGWLKSTNESWTRVAFYISLMALYVLGGTKVKSVSDCLTHVSFDEKYLFAR
jgi:hypothetical protein